MKTRRDIKDWSGVIMGSIDTDPKTGDQTAVNFYGRILGYYYANRGRTVEFSGRILADGNILSALIAEDYKNRKK